ncbi:universal stress protein [Phenylobacterium aquaticum]|uniref:universal stress protein n=1 Tax=Phenylobacterium aquaticum TaxID=1763816 RepID=UPI001F5DF789|nr:universal stress protein [Phenylobacterium aquaticum]MCI3130890.1 universal stress protein [Phenylobacterium aquaticum]
MSYATLLVPVEAEPEVDCRLSLAIDLANQFDAKLIGVGAELWRTWAVGGEFDGGYAAAEMYTAQTALIEADLQKAKAKFEAAAAAVRQGSDWRSAIQFPIVEVAAEARAADLIVTSPSRRHGRSDYNVATPAALALQTGRPVLVAPADAKSLELGRVLVAWRDTREARRALADALPILKRAKAVLVAEICGHAEAPAAEARLADVAQYLLRHGVRAATRVGHEERDVSSAQQLFELADQHAADLIVAGAYGHSRLGEWVFGGFTRALLAQTKRAVLLSH